MNRRTRPIGNNQGDRGNKLLIIITVVLAILLAGLAYFYFTKTLGGGQSNQFDSYLQTNGNVPTNIKYIEGNNYPQCFALSTDNLSAYYNEFDHVFTWNRDGKEQTNNYFGSLHNDARQIPSCIYFINDEIYFTYYVVMDLERNSEVGVLKLNEDNNSFTTVCSLKSEDILNEVGASYNPYQRLIFSVPTPLNGTFYSVAQTYNGGGSGQSQRITSAYELKDTGPTSVKTLQEEGVVDDFNNTLVCYTTFNGSDLYFFTPYYLIKFNSDDKEITEIMNGDRSKYTDVYSSFRGLTYNDGRLYFTNKNTLYSLAEDATDLETVTELWPYDDTGSNLSYFGDHWTIKDNSVYYTTGTDSPIKKLDLETKESSDFATIPSSHPEDQQNIMALYVGENEFNALLWYYNKDDFVGSELGNFREYSGDFVNVSFDATVSEPYGAGSYVNRF